MKKIYLTPETQIVEVELQRMIAESIMFGNSYNGSDDIESRDCDWEDED